METDLEQPAPQDSAPANTPADSDLLDQDAELLEQPTDDEIEDDLEGVKVRGKKDLVEKLKAERLMQADYTRKTQTLAEERRVIEEQRQSLHLQRQIEQSVLDDAAQIRAIDRELEQFNGINWNALIEQDPDTARKLELKLSNLQRQRQQAAGSLASKQQLAVQQQQASLAGLKERAEAFLAREVKGWSAERSNALAQYAIKGGVPQEALPNVIAHMPFFGVALHKAEMYDRLLQRQAQTRQKPAEQSAPVPTLTATKAAANRDPDKMSTEDWLKWRNAQVKRK